MTRFKTMKEMWAFVGNLYDAPKEQHVDGWCCVVQNNQRLLVNPWCRGDMRLLETEVNGQWV